MKRVIPILAVLCAGCAATVCPDGRSPAAAPRDVEIGVGAWNIELFDAAGPGDTTAPTRSMRHLRMIAEVILETKADLMGLEEVRGPRRKEGPYALEQLVNELNALERERWKGSGAAPVWRGASARPPSGEIHVALIWNTSTLEQIGRAVTLTSLSRSFGNGDEVSSKADVRFPRTPLSARFRIRAAPDNEFTVIVLHLKAKSTGIDKGLDSNDIRRRGELEDLLRKWLLDPGKREAAKNLIILGDMNEESSVLVRLLDEYGTGDDVRGRLVLDPADFSNPKALMLFTSTALTFPKDFTYQGNAEKGQRSGSSVRSDDYLSPHRKFIDHILISRALFDRWDGEYHIEYFETAYPLEDHIHLSDHRPVSIRLRFSAKGT
jgi:endonuclease/exonuclease/phosphatase family metal-dependent hydrolase